MARDIYHGTNAGRLRSDLDDQLLTVESDNGPRIVAGILGAVTELAELVGANTVPPAVTVRP